MIVRVPPMERSIPTPIPYQVERVSSCGYELDMDSGVEVKRIVREMRDEQRAELDALEDAVRVAYDMPPRKHGYDKPVVPVAPTPVALAPEPIPSAAPSVDWVAKVVAMPANKRVCEVGARHRDPKFLSIRVASESAKRFGGRLLCEQCQRDAGAS